MARRFALLYVRERLGPKIWRSERRRPTTFRESGRSYIHTNHIGQQGREAGAQIFSPDRFVRGISNLRPVVWPAFFDFFEHANFSNCAPRERIFRSHRLASEAERPPLGETAVQFVQAFGGNVTPLPPPEDGDGGARPVPWRHPETAGSTISPSPWRSGRHAVSQPCGAAAACRPYRPG